MGAYLGMENKAGTTVLKDTTAMKHTETMNMLKHYKDRVFCEELLDFKDKDWEIKELSDERDKLLEENKALKRKLRESPSWNNQEYLQVNASGELLPQRCFSEGDLHSLYEGLPSMSYQSKITRVGGFSDSSAAIVREANYWNSLNRCILVAKTA